MYFKVSMRTNPETGIHCGYYRLVESYCNLCGRVCHRTLLNAGYLDALSADQLNLIQKILTEKAKNAGNPLFDLPPEYGSYCGLLCRIVLQPNGCRKAHRRPESKLV